MVLQEKEGSIWEDYQTQIPPMIPCSHAAMGGKLRVDLLPSDQLDEFQGHPYSDNPHRYTHHVSNYFLVYT